jgi:POLQ-like helicase
MRPEQASLSLLGMTRSKAKMYEYGIPPEHHINITRNPAQLFTLTIGLLGDVSAASGRGTGWLDTEKQKERQQNLMFAARFFDAYLQARFEPEMDAYLLLLASSAFYLCDLPGTAAILAKRIPLPLPDLEAEGLEKLLHWLLLGDFSEEGRPSIDKVSPQLREVCDLTVAFYASGETSAGLLKALAERRQTAYACGTPRQLFLADIVSAITQRRIKNSAWHSMPTYSGLPLSSWRTALTRDRAIHELWPAQHLLGEKGVFEGKSAVVQMPTSAGKTRAIELVIRSAFLAKRTDLAVIVAPFRALCHEISLALRETFLGENVSIDELTDSLQFDFDLEQLLASKQILVVTPEKLVYMVRHAPELAASIGLIIYDEGHQFDSGLRGVTYELLLTSLRSLIAKNAQSILISAVITNGEAIGAWMHGPDTTVVSGANLIPMYRTVAFAHNTFCRPASL